MDDGEISPGAWGEKTVSPGNTFVVDDFEAFFQFLVIPQWRIAMGSGCSSTPLSITA